MSEDPQKQDASEGAKAAQYPNLPRLSCIEFLAPLLLEAESGAFLKPRATTSQLCRHILKLWRRSKRRGRKKTGENPKSEEDAPLGLFINKPFKYASVTIDGERLE